MKNHIVLFSISICLFFSCSKSDTNDEVLNEPVKLYEFMKLNSDKVLHGWGQSVDRWQSEAIPYFQEVAIPNMVSDYVSVEELRENLGDFNDLSTLSTWNNNGLNYDYIIMECLTNELNPQDIIAALIQLGFNLDPSDPDVFDQIIQLLQDPDIKQAVIDIVGFPDIKILNGDWDAEIIKLAEAIKRTNRPVLLRFMQEFIGGQHENDISGSDNFILAWRHFVDLIKENGATNAEFVWHPNEGSLETLEMWWPGDEYVDWIGISIFSSNDFQTALEHNQFAISHNKPFIIAESAPTLNEFSQVGTTDPSTWDAFFVPYFNLINNQPNIKGFFYINIDWSINSSFDWPMTRVQANDFIFNNYKQEIIKSSYFGNNEFWNMYTN